MQSIRSEYETLCDIAHSLGSFRTSSIHPHLQAAIASVSSTLATLTLVPLANDCSNCSELYGVDFSQTFPAQGARLVELRVSYSRDNPCCGGPESKDGKRRLIVAFPVSKPASVGKAALVVDELADWYSGDAEDPKGGTNDVCRTDFSYARDSAGNVNFISTEIHCTENEKRTPDVKKHAFRWNIQALHFDELK